jgi:hypothetical protein
MSDRFELRGIIAPTLVVLVMAGCGGGDGGDGGGGGGGGGGAAVQNPVDAATAGNISGSIVFEGDAPSMAVIDMAGEAVCAAKHSSPPMTEEVIANGNGTLANVFVYVKEGLESLDFPTPAAALLDQDGCTYLPHVLGVMVDQDITMRNSDGLLHNINASPSEQRGFNTSQPTNMESTRAFGTAEIMVPLRCDVHGWMNAYVGVVAHPYHSVSNSSGAFSLSTLPPGDYVIEAWHERYGTQTQSVTVTTGQTAEVTFTFSASMATNAVVPLGTPVDLHHSVAE